MIKDELASYTSNLLSRIGGEAATVLFEGQIGEAAQIVDGALRTGQAAPPFTLPDASGRAIALTDRLSRGPAIVTFYRGGWCPYCNIALRAFQARLAEITAHGATLIAISPERPDQSLSTVEKLTLGFDVLSDDGNEVARQYGLVYRVSNAARQRLLALGRDLTVHNGSDSWELPVTATYVIRSDGVIAFSHIDADYRDRPDPQAILDALSFIGAKPETERGARLQSKETAGNRRS